jgi:hypothetical protein
MSTPVAANAAPVQDASAAETIRTVFIGAEAWLESCCPSVDTDARTNAAIAIDRLEEADVVSAAERLRPDVTVVFGPTSLPAEILRRIPGTTLGVLLGSGLDKRDGETIDALDRVVSFYPELTGASPGEAEVWRAIPPPVNDALFAEVRRSRGHPRAITIGRSTARREWMLLPAKHHYDLLQVLHGVTGPALAELLHEHEVAVYVPPQRWPEFGSQVGMHLAAGQLLLAAGLYPAHGLERDIDYLHFDSPRELVRVLERLARFPDMHHRIRVRGRLKAEQFRASRLFARLTADLLADVAAFGSPRTGWR